MPENARPLETPGPLKIDGWKEELETHPDKAYVSTILQIIEVRAKIGYQGPETNILSENLASTNQDLDTLTKDLENQVRHDRVTKIDAPWRNFISFPL